MYQSKPTRQLAEHVADCMALQFRSVRENSRSYLVLGECPILDDTGRERYRSPVKVIFRKDRAADQFTLQTPGFSREMKRDGYFGQLEEEVMEALDSALDCVTL